MHRHANQGAHRAVAAGLIALAALGADDGRDTTGAPGFVVPPGYEIERVAGPPLVDRPIVAAFDERGRLYVADSSGSNDPVQQQLAERPHRVVRLEDLDGDGRFDRSTVFADRMMFPEGAMWLDGSLYVAAPPSIWKLTDTDDDGVADRREEWFQGKTLTGCANDLHGPYLGRDGRVYWCKGAFAEQTYERPGQPPLVTRAAHIFRARPDGTGIEPVMTGGMDNPVDVVFTEGGERIFTTTFLQNPAAGRRDGLIHAIYGGVYGKVHGVIDDHPRTGSDVMPVMTHLGPAAPAGLHLIESAAFGPEARGDLLACCFNLHKVVRLRPTPEGATFRAEPEDFVASPDLDFHPTDVIEDADGSVLVVDTGGWYKLCCPTSQLVKPDVLGAIYRVRKAGSARPDDPRGTELTWDAMAPTDLARLLDDPRPAVRRRAIEALGRDSGSVVPLLGVVGSNASVEVRRNAVWASARLDGDPARAVARAALGDADATVRQAALHAIALHRDPAATADVLKLLQFDAATPHNRRAAAEALGRIGDPAAVPALLAAVSRAADRVLEHSLIFAVIEIGDPEAVRNALGARADAPARRAALVALDQMGGNHLKPGDVAELLDADDPALRESASWIAGRHPEWGTALAGSLRDRLGRADLSPEARNELESQLARFAGAGPVADLLAATAADLGADPAARLVALRAMARSGLKEVPPGWVEALAALVAGADDEATHQAVAAARALPIDPKEAGRLPRALLDVAGRADEPAGLRVEALNAVPGGPRELPPGLFTFLLKQLDGDRPVGLRLAAADVLARAALDDGQRLALVGAVRSAGPLELGRLLPAFGRTGDEALGLALLTALGESAARAGLRPEAIRPHLETYGPAVRRAAEELYASLQVGDEALRAKVESLLPTLSGGDARRGQVVFNGTKAACSTCHAIGYLGGKVGPDLTKIGQIRAERDLLEAIVAPSASFVRSYEPVVVQTVDGLVHSGVLRADAPEEVVLAVSADAEVRIPRDRIEEMKPGTVSVMPAGLDQQLTPQELADLVAFLKANR